MKYKKKKELIQKLSELRWSSVLEPDTHFCSHKCNIKRILKNIILDI